MSDQAKQEAPTEEQRAEMDQKLEKIFRAHVTVDEEGEPILAIALDTSGLFLMAGTLNRGMALSTRIMKDLATKDPAQRAQAQATLSLASAQVKAFTRAVEAFVAENKELIKEIPGAAKLIEEEKEKTP